MQDFSHLIKFIVIAIFLIVSPCLNAQQREIDSLKLEFKRVDNDSLRVRVLGDLAYFYSSLDADSCFHYAQKTYALSRANDYLRGMVNGRYKMAMALMGIADFKGAENMALDMLDLSKQMIDTFRMTLGLNLLGVIQSQSGNSPAALKSLFQSAELSNLTGDIINSAYAYGNIGDIYQRGKDDVNAYKYFEKALQIWELETDTFELVTAYNNIAGITKDSLTRLNYALRAVALAEKIDYPIGLAYAYKTLGFFQWKEQKDLEASEISYSKALHNARRGDEQFTLVNNLIDLAALKIEMNKLDEASLLINESLPICQAAGLQNELQEISEYQALLNYKKGNFKSAYDHLLSASLLRDSIYNLELAEEISDANAKYELSQKEAEIAQQELEITKRKSSQNQTILGGILALLLATGIYQWYYYRQRRKQSDQLIAFNHKLANAETQALRSQMNPHFIFNALNSIKLYMLNEKPEKGSVYLDSFARLVRLVLQNSKESLITLEKELEALDLYIGLEKLRFDQAFDHEINISDQVETDFYEVPPLILQPFVENAIWHGLMPLESPGKLVIDISFQDETLLISITDNGIGRQRSAANKSMDLPYKKSMGLEITKERMELQKELTGVSIESHIHDLKDGNGQALGTRVDIRFSY